MDGDGEVDKDEWVTVMSRQQRARIRTELLSQVGSKYRHAVNIAITELQRQADADTSSRAAQLLARHTADAQAASTTSTQKKGGGGTWFFGAALFAARAPLSKQESLARRSGALMPRTREGPTGWAQFQLFALRYVGEMLPRTPPLRMAGLH